MSLEPKVIRLEDYKPSPFVIDSVELTADIFDGHTLITSKMVVLRIEKGETTLELNGEAVEFLEAKINGEVLKENFEVTNDKLILKNITQDKFELEIRNKIFPAENKAMEGFYQSGDQLCSQCEAEGFRKITYFLDRPDVMAKYRTKMIADKTKYPFLLSNGNRLESGDLPGGRHWVLWDDPFKKPSYLFAMVAGDFDIAKDSFVTRSGRKIALEIYVDKGNLGKTAHAMKSLQDSMKWDEDTFGLEYDLDIYMIVAVDSFNMGAMENKGLNIFNSTYTLASRESATDFDFQNVQGVIGHEYFHNWTGNRVTCRDWFNLTLKEGLTVFRDQEFSSDMLSRAVKRLEDVRLLKDYQFPEDGGPMSHPIKPASYIEINNFYTRTIYEKGSEVIRMIQTLIGKENFRKGMDKYFELFDGKAVTTEDFVHAMEVASGKDLTQFKNWYSRSGTPTLKVTSSVENGEFILKVDQHYPKTPNAVSEDNVLHLPFKIGLLDKKDSTIEEHNLELRKLSETFKFKNRGEIIVSLNRGFSAPVHVEYDYSVSDLMTLMAHDTDPYSRFEATQKIYYHTLNEQLASFINTGVLSTKLDKNFAEVLDTLLKDSLIDLSFKTYLLDLPTEGVWAQNFDAPDFDAIHVVHKNLQKLIGLEFQNWFLSQYDQLAAVKEFELTPKAFGERALKNQCLTYLVASETESGKEALKNHFNNASNMTEEIHALNQFVKLGAGPEHEMVKGFYNKWKHDSLVMIKWFASLSGNSTKTRAIEIVKELEKDAKYLKDVPNYIRALYMQFSKNNQVSFHDKSGEGYRFLAERIVQVDKFNPQVASRISGAFANINKLDDERRNLMKGALETILKSGPSKDTFEVVSKFLA